jgi:2-dehydro-3-deoxyglucarate aldolase/4-hydroxy-2-oxoheptanedioate aldolase
MRFTEKLKSGKTAFGTVISFIDPTVTELLSPDLDFVWIDMEHSPQTVQTVQSHIMATMGSGTTPLVRVPWNDAVLIKPVLDCGAAGIIVPMIRTAQDARMTVAACMYPPEGERGFGPRRPSRYGRAGGPAFCKKMNEDMICILQIEHADAIKNIDEIVAVPGIYALVIGPNDLASSMNHVGEPEHEEVAAAIDTVIASAKRTALPVGIGLGPDAGGIEAWIRRGMQWIAVGSDTSLLLHALTTTMSSVDELGLRR